MSRLANALDTACLVCGYYPAYYLARFLAALHQGWQEGWHPSTEPAEHAGDETLDVQEAVVTGR